MSLSRSIALVVILGTGACLNGTELVSPPYQPPTTITLAFRPDSEDAATASALGWTGGIPKVHVTLTPLDSTNGAPQLLQGSDTGTLPLDQLRPGRYLVEAARWLTDSERATLPRGDDALGFVARTSLNTATMSGEVPVAILASRQGGLVISEWAFNIAALPPTHDTYFFGGFLELYNNADTTVYLDGLILARGLVLEFDYPNFPCGAYAQFTNDPQGIWAREVQQFPGRGTDYPVPPGSIIVVAIDAIDHSKIVTQGLDLTAANFELWGGAGDVDNPSVPNMIDTLSLGQNTFGHGPIFQSLGSIAVLARPYSLATVPRARDLTGAEYLRISAQLIIDTVTLWPEFVSEWPRCRQLVNARFDRASFDSRGSDEYVEYGYSVSRRRTPASLGNRPLLQRSRNSAADFVRTLRSPGMLP